MSNETAVAVRHEMPLSDVMALGPVLAQSGYFSDAREASQAIVKVLAGQEMGFGPIASMTGINIIKGKPAPGANIMAAAVKANPRYDYHVHELTGEGCTIEFFEGKKSLGMSEFTAADAKKAGTGNMAKFPRNMLFARAMSNGVKWYCPDVFNGVTAYTPDELGAKVDEDTGEIIDVTPTPVQASDNGPDWKDVPEEQDPPGNGDGMTAGINKPADLLVAVNEKTGGYYNAVVHMLNAIKKETGNDDYRWPGPGDVAGYKEAFDILVTHVEAQTAQEE